MCAHAIGPLGTRKVTRKNRCQKSPIGGEYFLAIFRGDFCGGAREAAELLLPVGLPEQATAGPHQQLETGTGEARGRVVFGSASTSGPKPRTT